MVETPTLQALVLADHIYRDPNSGKLTILGTFNRLFARDLGPAKKFSRTTYAYVCMTNIRGKLEIRLRYRDLRTNEVLMETVPLVVNESNPLASVEMVLPVAQFPMPHGGVFAFELHAYDDMLGSLRVLVEEMKQEGQ